MQASIRCGAHAMELHQMHLMRHIQEDVLGSAMPLSECGVRGNVASVLPTRQTMACVVCLL